MPISNKSSWFDRLFPLIVAMPFYISVLIWLKLSTGLPHWDMGRHLYLTMVYDHLWQRVLENPIHLGSIVLNYYYYPPLLHNVGLFFESFFGFTANVAVASNIVWLLMLVYSVYFLAQKLFSRPVAVASVLFILASPMLIGQFREFQLDMPLMAIFALSLLLLVMTEKFTNRKFVIWFGLVAGLGMLTKWTFIFFIVPAGLLLLIQALADCNINKRQVLKNLGLSIFLAVLVCGAWYLRNLHQLKIDFIQNGVNQAIIEGDPHGFNAASFTWYLSRLTGNYLYLPLMLFVAMGLVWSVFKKQWFLPALIIIFYLIVSILPNKDVRYIMPIIVPISILGASVVDLSTSKIFKTVIIALLALIFVTNNLSIAFGKYLFPGRSGTVVGSSPYGVIVGQSGYTSDSPKEEACPMEEIISAVPEGVSARLIGTSHIDFADWAVAYYLLKADRLWSGQQDDLSGSEYLIHRNIDELPQVSAMSKIFTTAVPVKTFNCVDGSTVSVLKAITTQP